MLLVGDLGHASLFSKWRQLRQHICTPLYPRFVTIKRGSMGYTVHSQVDVQFNFTVSMLQERILDYVRMQLNNEIQTQ